MTSLPLAKMLFVIAVSMAPQNAHTLFATTNSDNYVWTQSGNRWSVETKGYPSDDWASGKNQAAPRDDRDMRILEEQRRSGERVVTLDNGNHVEQQGDAVFYIIDPGAPNQKVYTILYPGASR